MDRFEPLEVREWRSFTAVLQWRAEHQDERAAFVYLADGEREAAQLTFGALDQHARSVAAWLQEHGLAGKRIVLLYRAGLDFIVGFLGCLYAGAVAVPAYPPHARRPDLRLQSILDDCEPEVAFCIADDYERLSHSMATRGLKVVTTDTLTDQATQWKEPCIGVDTLAHLQYTSGSTDDPKGVMVSHGNLLHQVAYLTRQMKCSESTVNVTWQPFFHDMGLVGSVLTSIYCGAVTYVMAPEAFLRSPIRWLRAISKYGGTSAPAPNFAYDLCVTRTTPAQREGLDLSTWESAWNGAEPVRADTLDRFCEIYEPYGFRRRTFIPCYGMAETTLSATMDRPDRLPVIGSFRRDRLEQNAAEPCSPDHPLATRLVSSGVMSGDMEVTIVNTETLDRCADGGTGEIWVSGPSVAQGYWQRPDETERTFNAHLNGRSEKRYLRTGDLGFVRDGELFVTGRLKDLIIIRGRNVYPQDVELIAQRSHEALQLDGCVAFSVELDGHEELALALEVKRTQRHRIDPDELFEAVRAAIGEHFGVAAHWLGLVQPGRLPKTSSGKVMRGESRRQYLAGDLSLLSEWRSHARESGKAAAASSDTGLIEQLQSLPPSDRYRALVIHLQKEIARALELRGMPDPGAGFERLGIDSIGAVELVNRLQEQLRGKVNLPTTLLFDQPNIDAVARYVEGSLFGQQEQPAAQTRGGRPLDEPVAIVGLACRFPGAADANDFWRLLDEGRDAISEVPDNRWDIEAYFDPDAGAAGKMNTRFGGFIDDIEGFDAPFFDISPREATSMDPQHRHLLEVSWLALEDAGIAPARIDGQPVGVFVGISTSDYEQILAGRGPETADAFMATGNAHSAAVGRLSFALGLQGPCVAVDTACSSSLVAVHQAVQSLRQGECELALAGGVNAILRPEVTVAFCKARLLSPDGRCKTFDAAADGYVRSEGCGMVVLKRLSDAHRDNDRVLAVIRGSATNQDGRSSGLTAPNGPSQTQVIANALAVAKVDPASVQYLECHGTGTVLGDPIEVQAANAILSRGRDPEDPLVIGSVKSNLGHLEAAAGVAGLIKVVLALQHDKIPRSLHFRTPNPHIPWASMPVKVAAEALDWKSTNSRARIAGVSSFGFAGTNAHVVVEEPPHQEAQAAGEPAECTDGPYLLAISARTERGLKDLAGRYAAWLRAQNGVGLAAVCHAANTGRNHFEHRAVVICDSCDSAQQKLDAIARGESAAGTISGVVPRQHRPRVAFLFPGQGLQYAGMAHELYERAPAFRQCLDRCADAYDGFGREDGSPPLKAVMFDADISTELLKQTRYVQPALYALQVSLAALWQSWGVKPDALLGHSAGEYAAACVAGVFRVEDGLRLIVERARLMQTLPSGGTMLSVTAPVETIEAAIAGDASVQVSAYNGLNTVISGPIERLDALMEQFEAQELYCSKLPASNAFHSPAIEPILDDFAACARRIDFRAPARRLISTMTGKPVAQGEIPDAVYWRNQARQPVRFKQGIQVLFEEVGCDVALELGPQAELIWLAQMSWRPDHQVLWASSLAKGRNAFEQVLNSAAQLHANGATLDFASMETRERSYRKLSLPSYPFQHECFWPGPMGGDAASALRDCFYRVLWHAHETASGQAAAAEQQSWLILCDEAPFSDKLAVALRARGQAPVASATLAEGEASAGVIAEVLESARREGPLHHVVLIADRGARDLEPGAMWHAQHHGVIRALLVAQALIAAREGTQLWLVTRGAQVVREGDAVDPTHAAMWGFGRTFALEHPDRCGGLIDIALDGDPQFLADGLATALLCSDAAKQVALRDGQRWFPRLERYVLPDSPRVQVKKNATYLVTGGTGALGLAVARHLAERGAGQIVLTSRSGADTAAQEAIRDIQARGCRVAMICADISVRDDVARLFDEIECISHDRPLRGIIHAAGAHAGAPIIRQTPATLSQVLAPKVAGVWNLHRAALDRGIGLDLFVLFSSGASILGSRGHANYTASNAYLDSMAHYRRSVGLPALTINWGPWAGLGVAPQMRGESWDDIGIRLIEPATAMLAFDRLAGGPDAQVSMQPMDVSRWIDLAKSGRIPPILLNLLESLLSSGDIAVTAPVTPKQRAIAGKVGELANRFAKLGPIERGEALQVFIRERVGGVLGIPPDKVDVDAGFFDMGMNSIMAVELRGALEAGLGRLDELQAAVVFNHPTVRRLTTHLARHLFADEASAQSQGRGIRAALPAEAQSLDAAKLPEAIDAAAAEILGSQAVHFQNDSSGQEAQLRKAFAAILALRAELHELQSRTGDPIAIIGLSCRYPGADGPEAFWRVLAEGRDEIREVPSDRWDVSHYYDSDPDVPGKMNSRGGGFLCNIDQFDANFFGISPREARSLDPQQRLLLEVSWEALESANVAPRRLRDSRGGVFVGITAADYAQKVAGLGVDKLDAYAGTGNALCAAAGRLAFTLGWQGPALAMDTACSSSLVTLHEACTSLRGGECDIALAGGVNLLLDPAVSVTLAKTHALSPDDRCRTFDAKANGYVRSEGCGMVVLKRLSDAQRDGDRILAVVRGSAVNQDGRSSGLTVPNGLSQERVITDALKMAGVQPDAVQYLEAHGTGTPLGDPIEVQSANQVFSKGRDPNDPLLIGSLKSNIGHAEAAAGVASIIKVVLALQHEKLPQSIHFSEPNPHIPWNRLNVKVISEPVPWPRGGRRRIAGVSSFGFVGTNAHAVIEEPPAREIPASVDKKLPERGAYVLALSARTADALTDLAGRYADLLARDGEVSIGDLSYTANTGRDHFEQRAALVFGEREQLKAQLTALRQGLTVQGLYQGRVAVRAERRIAFMFTGQGSQSVGMGRELYRTEPVFRECFDRCAKEFARLRADAPDLRTLVFENAGEGLIDQTGYTQPALYALEVSLVALWRSWGVEPDVVLGHSVGEYAAAFTAGVFGLEDGLRLIAERGRLMQALPAGGGMAAVSAASEEVEAALRGRENVCIGAYNGADTVISGAQEEVNALLERFEAQGVRCRRLVTSHAFHSVRMEPILDDFRAFAASASYRTPAKRLISNVSGDAIAEDRVLDAEYWTTHIRHPVQFERGVRALEGLGCNVLLEIGPHPVLVGMGQGCWTADAEPLWVGSLRRGYSDAEQMLTAAASMYAAGVNLDFATMDAPWSSSRRKVDLPSYPFQRQRFWVDEKLDTGRRETQLARLFYELRWRASGSEAREASRLRGRTWLLLGSAAGVGGALVERLHAMGARALLAELPEDPAAIPERVAKSLKEATADSSWPLGGVVHLWALVDEEPEQLEGLKLAQERGVLSAFGVAQQLLSLAAPVELWLITRGIHRVVAGDRVNATHAPLWGFGNSIALSHPGIWGGLVDLPTIGDADALATQVAQTLAAGDNEDRIALREGTRWVARLEPASGRRLDTTLRLNADKSYLITGGLGGIGLQLGARLVERGARHLLLIARRAPGETASEIIRRLEDKGCEVRTFQIDVGRESEVSRLFDAIEGSDVPALGGIFHAAGISRPSRIDQLSDTQFVEVMAPKVWGAWLLDREVRARRLDLSLFVCVSSVVSVWGATDQADYAAANTYLDALMARRQTDGLPGCSINFGPWGAAGMAADEENSAQLKALGFRLFTPSLGLDAMEAAIGSGASQIVAVDVDWTIFKSLVEAQRPRPLLELVGESVGADEPANDDVTLSQELTRLRSATKSERVQWLSTAIRTEVANVLGVKPESLEDDTSVLELGLDSLMAVDLVNRLRRRLRNTRFSPRLVYDYPTISELAMALDREIATVDDSSPATESSHHDDLSPEPLPRSTLPDPLETVEAHYRTNGGLLYTCRRYRDGDKAGVIFSYAKCFGQKTATVLNSVFDWKYLESSLDADDVPVVDVLECGGTIVGMNGGIRARFKLGDTTVPGIWSCDVHVVPEHREVTSWFLQHVNENFPGIVLGMPNAAVYPFLSATESVIDLDRCEHLKACLDLGGVLRSRGSHALLSSVCGLAFWPVPRIFDLYASLRIEMGIAVTQIPRFDDRFDELWQIVSRDYPGIMVRDRAFLSWRFDRFPIRDYTRYVAERNGTLVGYMVVREIQWRGARRGRIVDYLVGRNDSAAFDCLVRAVMRDLRSRGTVSVTCSVSSSQTEHVRRLRHHGFLHAEARANVVGSRGPHEGQLAAIKNWFFTFADADADYNEDESAT